LSENLNFFKTRKNSYTGPLCIPIQNMEVTAKKYGVSISFCRKTHIDFEQKFEIF
jgi:hypothetical protein